MAEEKWWASSPFATAASARASAQPAGRAKTTPQDMMLLRDSTTHAENERSARQAYRSTRGAVEAMNTGPVKAAFLDAITPEQDGGVMDTVGGFLGAPLRLLVSDKTWAARDQLNTLSSQMAIKNAQALKGALSDRDMSLVRQTGISPYKSKAENLRILAAARRESVIEQSRAVLKSKWISRFGSISVAGPGGLTYEEAAARQDAAAQRALDGQPRSLPKPPPRRPQGGRTVIDINGNPIR